MTAQYHPSIVKEIISLFSDDILNGYYTPLLNLQNSFQNNSKFEKLKNVSNNI